MANDKRKNGLAAEDVAVSLRRRRYLRWRYLRAASIPGDFVIAES